MCRGGYQNRPRRSREEARRRIDGVTGHRVGASGCAAEVPSDNRTGVDADMKPDGPVKKRGPPFAQFLASLDHVEGSTQGADRIVAMRPRRAENRHDGVANVLFDEPAISSDDFAEHLEQRILKCPNIFRVKALGKGRKAGDISKQHRDLPPVGS